MRKGRGLVSPSTQDTRVGPLGSAPFPVAVRAGRCPSCAHEAVAPSASSWRSRGRHGRRPAICRVSDGVDDPSGWPTECGCTDAFHGS